MRKLYFLLLTPFFLMSQNLERAKIDSLLLVLKEEKIETEKSKYFKSYILQL